MDTARWADSVEGQVGLLVEPAVTAARDGDYGIAAGLFVSRGDVEVAVVAANTMFTAGDPSGHAEINVLTAFRTGSAAGARFLRTARGGRRGDDRVVLRTSVEPCPMCTVAILNAGIDDVVWAVPDEEGGAFDLARADRLPPAFASARERVSGARAGTDPADPLYVPADVMAALRDAFLAGRAALDARLAGGGVLDVEDAWHRVAGS